jgi:Tfp pilus assembly protein PilN
VISINFASRDYRLISRVRTVLVAGCVVLALTAAGMLWKAFSLRAEIVAVEQAVKERGADEEQVRSLIAEREHLVKDLSTTSDLMELRKFSWTRLLTSIEAVVPAGAALKSVDFNPADRTVTLEGAARSPESLRNLIVGLEKSASFKDPFLKHQSLEKGTILFNVVAVYREDESAAMAHREK